MEPVTAGLLGILLLLVLLGLGMPIAFALMFTGFAGITVLAGIDSALPMTAMMVYDEVAVYPYMVIPLFIVMGSFAGVSGLSQKMFSCLNLWMQKMPGGLAVVSIAACALFSAVSGSAIATTATLGNIALPEMKRHHYSDALSTGAVAAGGTLGFLIPPSLGFVVYGMLTEQSTGKLLIAGILPGILLAVVFCGVVTGWVKLQPQAAPRIDVEASWHERFVALKDLILPLVVFVIVMAGIYGGVFTPTEAGAVGATILFFHALFTGSLSWKNLMTILEESLRISVMTLFLVTGASIFTSFLALSTIPMVMTAKVLQLGVAPTFILLAIIIFYLFLGCFLDAISMMVLTMPVVLPILSSLHCDLIWFGVVSVLMMQAGLITPPLGLNIFTITGIAKDVKVETVFKGVTPFLLAVLAVVLLLLFFPAIATWLPSKMIF